MTTRHTIDLLDPDLREWLPRQRWFADKGRPPAQARVATVTPLADDLLHLLVEVDGEAVYQVLVGLADEVPEHLEHAVIGRLGDSVAYDAAYDSDHANLLLELMAADADRGDLSWRREPGVRIVTGLHARPVGVEQSNTSIVFGQHYILKLFRRPLPEPNRDVMLHRALREVGSEQIAEPVGVFTGHGLVLGFMQRYLGDAAEGWATATASVRDLFAEGDLHAGEVGGDFAGEAGRLGAAVAAVHLDLGRALGRDVVGPEVVRRAVEEMHGRLDAVLAEVPELAEHEQVVREAFDAVRDHGGMGVQHVHGDLHLGQVLRTVGGWVLIDFEGEPAGRPEDRMRTRSPLRDVAGMLRSFDYAALHLLVGEDPDHQHLTRAAEWADRNRVAFCDGYASVGPDPREDTALLRAFELDKAVYEVAYEHRSRPDWLHIPLTALRRSV